jgi:hypothetical protein
MDLKLAQELFENIDGSLYWKSNYRKSRIGKKAGVPHSKGYVQVTYKTKLYMEHRIVFLMHYGYVPQLIDHINGNKADNKILNLQFKLKIWFNVIITMLLFINAIMNYPKI